ncbi:MAG: hypothetical protein AB1560_00625 [Pseudomonadota bacterium]
MIEVIFNGFMLCLFVWLLWREFGKPVWETRTILISFVFGFALLAIGPAYHWFTGGKKSIWELYSFGAIESGMGLIIIGYAFIAMAIFGLAKRLRVQ